jgi:hypothetical protein
MRNVIFELINKKMILNENNEKLKWKRKKEKRN